MKITALFEWKIMSPLSEIFCIMHIPDMEFELMVNSKSGIGFDYLKKNGIRIELELITLELELTILK